MPRRPKPDPARAEADRILSKVEKALGREYAVVNKEVTEKVEDYFRRFEKKDATWRRWVASGKRTPEQYRKWREQQMFMGDRWKALKATLAEDYVNTHHIAESVVNGYMPDVYAVSHNYGTYLIENGSSIDTSYTLYNHEAVERMWRENPKLYPDPGKLTLKDIRDGRVRLWSRQQIQSVMTQGLLMGESIPDLAKRLQRVTGGLYKAAIRNARTMTTGVEAAGRLDAFKRAEGMGIKNKKVWVATLDRRTRHWHRELDGVAVPNDKPFKNSMGYIMFPGDPDADGVNIYNCRCALNTQIQGHEIDYSDLRERYTAHLGKMSYEEWKNEKRSISHPILKQYHQGQAAKAFFIGRYRNGD